jgi:fatty-acyl-CoA synthase
MMQQPLLISSLLTHAERHHGDREVVSRRVEGDLHRTTYRELARRSRRLANALAALRVSPGDRVATLAWNGYRHMELYYAVSGSGAVLHTLNPRLHPDQVVWIADHAEDQVLFFDLTFLPLVEAIADRVSTIKTFVVMTDREHMPAGGKIPGLLCYEDLVDAHDDTFEWPTFDENSASSLCYTSGTTGNPKGALYSHRSTLLHTFAAALPDGLNCSARDTILPVVPMFHVNAWGLPYAACMVGAKLVFPGPFLDGESLHRLFELEGVTVSAGVPTVWQGLLAHVESNGLAFSTMRRTIIGGSACPPAMMRAFQERYDVQVLHAWGMTEMSPLGTACTFKPKQLALGAEERLAVQAKQGRVVFGVDMKIVGDDGRELPWDGAGSGELLVRGPTATVSCRSPTAPRTSSRAAASGSARSTSRTSPWRTPRSRWPRASPRAIRSGTSARSWWWSRSRASRSRATSWSRTSTARSPSGGRPTTWCSSNPFRSAPPAR